MGNHPKTTLKTDVLQSQSAQGPMLYTLQVFLPMPSRQVATNTSFLGPMRGVRYRYNMDFEHSWLKFIFYVVLDDLESSNWNNQFLIGGSPLGSKFWALYRAKFQKWRSNLEGGHLFFETHAQLKHKLHETAGNSRWCLNFNDHIIMLCCIMTLIAKKMPLLTKTGPFNQSKLNLH